MKLHLFNEVFIDYHTEMHIPQGSKVIIFSDTYNTDMDTNPNCVSCHDTLDARLDGDTIQDFFTDTIALTGQHIIYANEDDFARIVASWLRSTTNMTADEFGVWLGISLVSRALFRALIDQHFCKNLVFSKRRGIY